jgi:hypothetical protein
LRTFDKQAFARLEERIQKMLTNGLVVRRNQALIHLFMAHRFYADSSIIVESFTDGGNDCGVDAVYIDRRGEEPIVHLFQSKVFESERKAKNPFPAGCLDKINRFMEIVTDKRLELKKVTNPQLEQKVLEIRDAIEREFPVFQVWLIGNGMPCLDSEARPILQILNRQSIKVEQVHLDELVEFCLNDHSTRTNHVFFARDSGTVESGNTELRSVVGYISGMQLYKLLADLRDETKIDYTLFNMNVRGFLGLDSPINREIFRSAASVDNANFAAFNNGITIVCSQCRVNKSMSDGPKIGIKRMSIVNGAQTCSAIFDAMKDYYPRLERFEKLSLLFRIFETEDPELISKIAMSTNNQNRINARDLRANDKEQIDLEKSLAEHNIRYQRKRGIFPISNDSVKSIDALKVGQLLMSYVHLDPARAKRDSDSIFTEFYHKIFGSVDVSKLLEAMSWFELIELRRVAIEDEIRIRGQRRTENTFVTYGVFHILMLCGMLAPQCAPGDREGVISGAINLIGQKMKDAGDPAFYSYFRDTRQSEILREAASQPQLI